MSGSPNAKPESSVSAASAPATPDQRFDQSPRGRRFGAAGEKPCGLRPPLFGGGLSGGGSYNHFSNVSNPVRRARRGTGDRWRPRRMGLLATVHGNGLRVRTRSALSGGHVRRGGGPGPSLALCAPFG